VLYEIRRFTAFGRVRGGIRLGYGRAAQLDLGPVRPTFITRRPPGREGESLELDLFRREGRLEYRVSAQPAVGAGRHVYRLEVFDPSGQVRPCYSRTINTPEGAVRGSFSLGLAEPNGVWEVRLQDVVTDATVARAFVWDAQRYVEPAAAAGN
jgi:hypothetical protein